MKEILDDDYSHPAENQSIVKILASRGNNLHEIETAADIPETFLVSMPTKFRKNVWVKRGDYVIVEPIEEGDKVKAEIVRILTPEHIKIFTKDGVWPKKLTKKREIDYEDDDADESDSELFQNHNRKHFEADSSDETTDDDEEDDNDEK